MAVCLFFWGSASKRLAFFGLVIRRTLYDHILLSRPAYGGWGPLSSSFQAHFWSPNTTPKADPPFLSFSRSPVLYPAVLKALTGIFQGYPCISHRVFQGPSHIFRPFQSLIKKRRNPQAGFITGCLGFSLAKILLFYL